ncbi:MAG: hypothetical protein SA339_12055 [Methanomassiliicoccus sp.]|nr:hypothetical protein [Methanomassiliicoccus sp.]
MRKTMIVTTVMVALAVVAVAGMAASQAPSQQGPQTASEVELRLAMQHLWETHVRDLNDLIFAVANGEQAQVQAILNKSLEHVDMTAAALEPFYGQQNAAAVDNLLRMHEMGLYSYIVAAESGDRAAMQAAMANSTQVIGQVAQCLSSLNPNWPYEAVSALLQEHLADAADLTQLVMDGNYVAAQNALDMAVEHAQVIANTMANGLVAQFPEGFSA